MNAQLTFTYLQQQQLTDAPIRRVCDMPADDRPLYRLHKNGANALASLELLTLALGGAEAHGLAADLLARFGSLHQLARASKAQLMHLRGIGEAQAARLTAIVELSRATLFIRSNCSRNFATSSHTKPEMATGS